MGVPNRLGMKEWVVIETLEDAHDMKIVAGKPVPPDVCPRCGVENPRVYKHDQQEQTFMDTPIHGKRAAIQVIRQRYRCLECGDELVGRLLALENEALAKEALSRVR